MYVRGSPISTGALRDSSRTSQPSAFPRCFPVLSHCTAVLQLRDNSLPSRLRNIYLRQSFHLEVRGTEMLQVCPAILSFQWWLAGCYCFALSDVGHCVFFKCKHCGCVYSNT